MNIITISLKRAEERRNNIQEQFKKLNLDNIIMDAVDAKELTEEQLNKYISPGGWRAGEKFKPGEIACTMSHIKAIELAQSNNWDYVIILEDDAIIAEDFEKRIKFLFKILPQDWEHVYLSGIPHYENTNYNESLLKNTVAVYPSMPNVECTLAMMIRNTAYDKIKNYLNTFTTTTDDMYMRMIKNKLIKSYIYHPFCVYAKDDYTYIWNINITREHKSKLWFKNKI